MKVTPAGQKPTTYTADTGKLSSSAEASRAKAIAMLTNSAPQPQNTIEDIAMAIPKPEAIKVDNITPVSEVTEESQVPAAPPEKKADPLSSQYALLARKERALRQKAQQQEQNFKAREEQIKQELKAQIKAELDKEYSSQYVPKSRLRDNTLEVMAENDLSYDAITQQLINQQPTDPRMQAHMNRMAAQIQKLETALEKSNSTYSENQQQAYTSAVKQIEADVTSLINSDPDFEVVKATRSVKDVVQLIERTYKEDGRLMSVEEAAKEVEDYLIEEALKLSKISKIQKRSAAAVSKPQQTAPAQQSAAKAQPQQQPMRTLTNATGTSRQLTAKERAILAFRGELK